MEKNYNVSGAERKTLVNKIAETTGKQPVYLGMPSVAFKVGPFEISRNGRLTWDEGTDDETVSSLVGKLKEAGFTAEEDREPEEEIVETPIPGETSEEETPEEPDHLSISVPDDLTDAQFALLSRLVAGKETLLKHAFQTDSVEIEREEGKLTFPWFIATDGDHTNAYMVFLTKLIKFAKEAKRVTVHDQQVDNEKFSFRIFLIRLGMIGEEYKGVRKVLLENLTGNSAWRNGSPAEKSSKAAVSADQVEENREATDQDSERSAS